MSAPALFASATDGGGFCPVCRSSMRVEQNKHIDRDVSTINVMCKNPYCGWGNVRWQDGAGERLLARPEWGFNAALSFAPLRWFEVDQSSPVASLATVAREARPMVDEDIPMGESGPMAGWWALLASRIQDVWRWDNVGTNPSGSILTMRAWTAAAWTAALEARVVPDGLLIRWLSLPAAVEMTVSGVARCALHDDCLEHPDLGRACWEARAR